MAGLTGSSGDLRLLLFPLLLVTTFIFFANVSYADEIFLTVNVKKPLALTSDKFLSYTLDPTVVLTGDALTRNPERSINMARALSPAFVRIGGPRSNSYTFVRPHRMHYEEDPDFTITETNWIDINRWAENAGLDILVCITPQHTEIGVGDSVWDSRNALDLISFSDQMGFNTSWQLGYECQTRCDVTGIDSGKAVTRLRSMLDVFPRYSKSLVTGPDVVAYRTKQQQQYLQDYLNVAGNALSAITWHPTFSTVTLDDEGVSMQHDNLAFDRDSLYRSVGRPIWKKPLWIAESKPEDCKKQFLGALVWTRRLGNAARLGIQVIMRQPNGSNLLQPTPDYWVSVLHKALVGREVLDARITNGNRSHVHFYCQCTKPSSKYEKGSLTIFGINLTPDKIIVNLKSLKVKTVHKYILLPGFDADNRMFAETVLLNNVPLKLVNERQLPEIRPTVLNTSKGVSLKLPSGGIGFWVLPGLKIKSCGGLEDDNTDRTLLKRLSKRLVESESEEDNVAGEEGNWNDNFWMKSNKNRKRSKQFYNGEDDNERHYIKIEAKQDLEKLEKLLRKRDTYDDRMSMWRGRTSYFGFDDRSPEKRLNENDFEDETSREIRDKLKEYKRRLKQYEYKIRRVEPFSRAYPVDSEETIDSEKVIDAMRLISKMENAMRKLEVGERINKPTLDRYGMSNVKRTLNNDRNPDDTFLDKLLDSKKIKRTSVPSRIEDQLQAIYQMLADEKERRRRNNEESEKTVGKQNSVVSSTTVKGNFSRPRREAEKKFGVDPLGLRKEGMYRRLSRFTDETRDRRHQRKEDRRDIHAYIIDSKDTSDSEEDDFYGFHKHEPIKNFPKGDVHLSIGSSEEETPSDYDYEIDDDEKRHLRKPFTVLRRHKTPRAKLEEDKDLWVEVENIKRSHVPIDFFENIQMSTRPRILTNTKGHSELWEDESISKKYRDTSSAEIDRLVTVQEIVPEQYPDAQKDRRTKELIVEKLINYFKGPSAETDEVPEYESAEELEHPKSDTRTPAQTTSRDESSLKVEFDAHYQTPVVKRKRVKAEKRCETETCPTSDDTESLTGGVSMEFNKSSKSSEEEESTSTSDTSYKITDEPANRKKRSTNNLLVDILDREMIFQDDNNLKDCDCRVPRSTRDAGNDGDAKKRKRLNCPLKKSLGSARRGPRKTSPLRKNRKREETSISKPNTSQQENNSRKTRRKRNLESQDQKITQLITEVPVFVSNNTTNIETTTTKGMVQEKSELPKTDNQSLDSERYESTKYDDLPKNLDTQDDKATKDESLNNEMINGTTDSKATGTHNVVKRRDKTRSSPNVAQSQGTNFETGEASTSKIEPKLEEEKFVTTISPNTKFFRFRKNRKELARKLNETTEETSSSDSTTLPSVGAVRSPFYKSNKMVSSRKSVTATTNAPSSTAVPEKDLEETIKKMEEPDAVVTKSSKTNKKRERPESAMSKLRRKMVMTTTTTPTIPATTENLLKAVKTAPAEISPEVKKLPQTEITPLPPTIAPKLRGKQETTTSAPIVAMTKNNDEKKLLKSKKIELFLQKFLETSSPSVVAPMKNNGEKKSPKPKKTEVLQKTPAITSAPVVAPVKNDDEKKSLKSKKTELLQKLVRTTPSPVVASVKNNDEKKSLKSKKNELLQKLQEKLREKREKLVNDYREELLSEIVAASEQNRNLYRREIMDMMMNEAELRDLVDQTKFEYLKHNKPIDYEVTELPYGVNDTKVIGQKYVPEMLEILRPIHATRERKVKPRTQHIGTTINPELLIVQEEAAKTERISLRLNDDTANHKIARRDGEPYHGNDGSLESLPFYEPLTYEEDFHDRTSGEMKESAEFDESMENSSYPQSDKKIMPNYTDQNRFDYSDELGDIEYDTILDPNNGGRIQSLKISEELGNSIRKAGSHNYVLLETNSEQSSSESAEKLLKYMKGKNPYSRISEDDTNTDIKAVQLSKKRNFKSSDFDSASKYDSPKYARLSVDRSKFLQGNKAVGTNVNNRESKETLTDVGSKILRKKKIAPGDENTSWIVKRLMENFQENHSAMIDYADLDEALNSGDYELVMLIPVNDDQKKNRQKRNVENQITRDPENSATSGITIEMMPKNSLMKKDGKINYDNLNIRINEIASDLVPLIDLVNDNEKDGDSLRAYSIPILNKRLTPSKEKDVRILGNGFPEEETIRSVPEIFFSYGEKSLSDERLPDLLEEAVPKVEATVPGRLGKVRRISESFEKFIDDFDDRFNQEELEFDIERDTTNRNAENSFPISSDILGTTVMNVKKFFNFLSGLVQVFRVN